MTEQIKKNWQKMSRQLKKMGINHTCVMNAAQMRKGTATICVDFITNPAANIAAAEANDLEKEIVEHARYDCKLMTKERRKLYDIIFLPGAERDLQKDPNNKAHQEYYNYCIDAVVAYDNGRFYEFAYGYQKKRLTNLRNEYIAKQKAMPTYSEQVKRSRERYAELIAAAPVQEFMTVNGASVMLEEVPEGAYTRVYARFMY